MRQLTLPIPELTYKNRDWLVKQYVEAKKAAPDIAREVGCNPNTVWRWLDKFGIPRRSKSEAKHLAQANHAALTPDALEFIEGELLGDGNLTSHSKWSALYRHGSKHKGYVEWLSKTLASFGIEQSGRIYHHKNRDGSIAWNYESLAYEELRPLYEKWYPQGKKAVPPSLILTPLVVRQWYIGDGGLAKPQGRRPRIKLATYGFTPEDVDRLVAMLRVLGFDASRQPSKNGIYISTYSAEQFLNYIGPCPKEIQGIYGYKFDYTPKASLCHRSSKYRGVCWDKSKRKWQARFQVAGEMPHLGYFDDEREAALAYDKAAKRILGEQAHLNFPDISY